MVSVCFVIDGGSVCWSVVGWFVLVFWCVVGWVVWVGGVGCVIGGFLV